MVGVGCGVVINCMTILANRAEVGVIPVSMAFCTFVNVMPHCKREETMVECGRRPAGIGGMAGITIR